MNELIDKFLNKQLSKSELKQFNSLLGDKKWVQDTYQQLLLQEALTENSDNDFRSLLDEITYEYQHKQTSSAESFVPVNEYEENLEGIARAGDIPILKPVSEANYTHYLPFRLERAIPTQLLLIIENNDFDELIRQEIPAHSIAFNIDIAPEKGFKPGRYYWKLASNRHQVSAMGVFFIGKGLMTTP